MRSDHQEGRSWGRRGQSPVIRGTGQRFRGHMISALTSHGQRPFMVFGWTFAAAVFVSFLRLPRHTERRVFFVADGHAVHRAAVVARWVGGQQRRLRLCCLPGHGPDIGPDESLHQDVKTAAVGRQRPPDEAGPMGRLRRYLWSTGRRSRRGGGGTSNPGRPGGRDRRGAERGRLAPATPSRPGVARGRIPVRPSGGAPVSGTRGARRAPGYPGVDQVSPTPGAQGSRGRKGARAVPLSRRRPPW